MKPVVHWQWFEARSGGARQAADVSSFGRRPAPGPTSQSGVALRLPPQSKVLVALCLVCCFALRAPAQTIQLFEGFEGNFPEDNGWSVGDANPDGLLNPYWEDVNLAFGGEGSHTGNWKGYCAGTAYPFNSTGPEPFYEDYMDAFMSRSVSLTGFTSANLTFWHKIPGIEACCDRARVWIDANLVWESGTATAGWTEVNLNLNPYLGGAHTLEFNFYSDLSVFAEGWYLDDITVSGSAGPSHDFFSTAIPLAGAAGSRSDSNTGATREPGEPNIFSNPGGRSVWYRWTAPSSARYVFRTSGSAFDTILGVYTGNAVGALTLVGHDDDGESWSRTSRVAFQATAGTTYYIAVDGYNGVTGAASGIISLHWGLDLPDVIVWAPSIAPFITVDTFASTNCEVVEGTVQAGCRRLLRFTTEARNIGESDLDLGDPTGNTNFMFAPCHMHYHFTGYAEYRLLQFGLPVISGRKTGFCLEDVSQFDATANPSSLFVCGHQGAQRGWADVYGAFISGQWLDITDVPPGSYTLELEVNPSHVFAESDYSNNKAQVPVTIPPLSNDNFVNALSILGTSVSANNSTASKEAGEPSHAGNIGGRSLWWCLATTNTVPVTLDTLGSSFDTLLAVYTGNAVNALTSVAANDDIQPGVVQQSRVNFTAQSNRVYRIAVDGYFNFGSGTSIGTINLNLHPGNNDFANCQVIAGNKVQVGGFNGGAGKEASEPNHAGNFGGNSVWYCWTAPLNGLVAIDTLGSTFNTLLAVYTGDTINTLSLVAQNDDTFFSDIVSLQSRVGFNASAGTLYRIAVDGKNGATGSITLNVGYRPSLAIARLGNGNVRLTLLGLPISQYEIQASADLRTWTAVGTVTTDIVNGRASYDAVPSDPQQFYRAQVLP